MLAVKGETEPSNTAFTGPCAWDFGYPCVLGWCRRAGVLLCNLVKGKTSIGTHEAVGSVWATGIQTQETIQATETRFYGVCVYEEKVDTAEELRRSFLVLRIRMVTLSAFNVSLQDLSAITLDGWLNW